MKIEISEHGSLLIERGGEMKHQLCPWTFGTYSSLYKGCGDWCPHFSVKQYEEYHNLVEPNKHFVGIAVNLCHEKTITCPVGDFTDMRKEAGK